MTIPEYIFCHITDESDPWHEDDVDQDIWTQQRFSHERNRYVNRSLNSNDYMPNQRRYKYTSRDENHHSLKSDFDRNTSLRLTHVDSQRATQSLLSKQGHGEDDVRKVHNRSVPNQRLDEFGRRFHHKDQNYERNKVNQNVKIRRQHVDSHIPQSASQDCESRFNFAAASCRYYRNFYEHSSNESHQHKSSHDISNERKIKKNFGTRSSDYMDTSFSHNRDNRREIIVDEVRYHRGYGGRR